MDKEYDIAIIGAGPGGYVAAIRAAQLRKKVLLVEKNELGGTCTNWGCIPTKFLLQQTKKFNEAKTNKNLEGPINEIKCNWEKVQTEKSQKVAQLVKGIDFLLKNNGVDTIRGEASLIDGMKIVIQAKKEEKTIRAKKIILATGSRPAELPFLKRDGDKILNSTDALDLIEIPRRLLVIGAGAIGLEIGTIFQRLGTEVTILEILPQILPGSDKEICNRLERVLKRTGIKIYTRMKIKEVVKNENQVFLKGICLKDNSVFKYGAEKVLLAAGRIPVTEICKKNSRGFLFDKAGFVKVDAYLKTNVPGILAIGDLIGGKLLAHKAYHEGIIAVENAFGAKKRVSDKALPMAVFIEPEFSSVGLTEQEAKKKNKKVKVGLFSLQANGRALTMGSQEGMIKVIADAHKRIIGAHILAPYASELIAEMTMAVEKKLVLQDVASLIHIHPTLSEALKEAAMNAENKAIHTLSKRE